MAPRSPRSKRVVVTGGAGFVGSHLCEALLERGDAVVCVDDLSTGSRANVAHLEADPRFELVVADVSVSLDVDGPIDAVAHLASPASPAAYRERPLETLAVGSSGTRLALELASRHGARFVLASTSEVYGDPLVHPQHEGYWGNVDPVGPRSPYDEAKRYAEALTVAHRRARGTDVGIVRIFNTYGPRMQPGDGRVVSTFVAQALTGEPLTVHGDGSQTRSLCYVDDLVAGLLAMLDTSFAGPVNLGNPEELTILELARRVIAVTGSRSEVVFVARPHGDPSRRCPDIRLARERLGFAPRVSLEEGLRRTAAWLRGVLGASEGRGAES
jgi:dTDP-glucose 4,6-dehydratase